MIFSMHYYLKVGKKAGIKGSNSCYPTFLSAKFLSSAVAATEWPPFALPIP